MVHILKRNVLHKQLHSINTGEVNGASRLPVFGLDGKREQVDVLTRNGSVMDGRKNLTEELGTVEVETVVAIEKKLGTDKRIARSADRLVQCAVSKGLARSDGRLGNETPNELDARMVERGIVRGLRVRSDGLLGGGHLSDAVSRRARRSGLFFPRSR